MIFKNDLIFYGDVSDLTTWPCGSFLEISLSDSFGYAWWIATSRGQLWYLVLASPITKGSGRLKSISMWGGQLKVF